MALQLSVSVRNGRLDSLETTIGTAPLLRVYTGTMPADCATAASGTLLAEATLPSDWMAAAASGSKAMTGTWEDISANATGMAAYFRHYDSAGTTCHIQGLVAQTWAISTAYVLNQQVSNDSGKCYKCITAGTSAGSGGPTGTGADITDGTAHWQYIGTADMTINNTSFATGQDFVVTSFTLTDANA